MTSRQIDNTQTPITQTEGSQLEPQSVQVNYSLRQRLLLVCSVVLIIFIGLTALILDQAFKQSLDTELNDRLQTQIYLLMGASEFDHDQLNVPQQLNAPRFNQIDSGLFATIHDQHGQEVWRSQSAQSYQAVLIKPKNAIQKAGQKSQALLSLNVGEFFSLSFGIAWELENQSLQGYTFTVAESTTHFNNTLDQYRLYLWAGLAILAVLLLLVFTLTLYWGLTPLSKLALDLKSIENGSQEQLSGSYPQELKGLTQNLNLLLQHEKRQHSRYRNTLANLAHSLKTPLAVLQGIVDKEKYTQPLLTNSDSNFAQSKNEDLVLLGQQVVRMNEIVQHQLQRAVQVGPQTMNKALLVLPLVERMKAIIQKVYFESVHSITLNIEATVLFKGDEGDLMEVLGNLMDNAGKYGNGQIVMSAQNIQASDQLRCRITVEDNGKGIPTEMAEEMLQRGVRADQKHQGQGIGLAMVVDIVDQYQGRLNIMESSLGGAKIEILI
ncbi:MAG: ATP-binding protein [Bermanella sp.]